MADENVVDEKVEEQEESEEMSKDASENKGMAILAYIGFLFIVPLLAAKESEFAKFHTNQGILLFILGVAISIVGSIIPFIGWLIILPFGYLAWLVLAIMGIINAANGKKKALPLIGGINILS
ncbi:DUF4870 domain-containing protein [Ornithinibacillus halophilus]|uniref:Uncharacterized membrane protein n=1 Tax=Ornithinibacillus halophilus TaxID=930117 RepID=A0A1M5J449_9BACI|nr:hypothetical protein [Ornithinibacillus halophilus]SHG35334.1 Uncharacterized membrane protein [Ornithinibacillus halophilus]